MVEFTAVGGAIYSRHLSSISLFLGAKFGARQLQAATLSLATPFPALDASFRLALKTTPMVVLNQDYVCTLWPVGEVGGKGWVAIAKPWDTPFLASYGFPSIYQLIYTAIDSNPRTFDWDSRANILLSAIIDLR
ncbi:uncharacterized protein EV420DRAFT_1482887 [Desarmillaria tabescens]|uniref:Uncharacterized protein n=1 Tax=Armillaria tabescens TaxID=1929756 RepID=A0AA39JWT6_ARMTA|nr:uncharacterized protein EV420DRAFT_1482887 [Desarmillaria tabescens]KAK0450381.1 hypothetical protein EV420DRAFT_1482887 [Desarmillaria tabescens]